MEYPSRKAIRLKNYDYSANGTYFITICTHERQNLFDMPTVGNDLCVVPSNAQQNQITEKWLIELQNKFNIIIDKFVIMPNHIHFILIINSANSETERHIGRSLLEKSGETNDKL